MKRISIVLGVVVSLAGSAAPAVAQTNFADQYCTAIGQGIANAYLADTGDGKGATLIADNKNCMQDGDKDWRWRVLSLRWRALMNAVQSGDAQRIASAAEDMRVISMVTSNRYQSCWATMIKYAKMIGKGVDEAVSALSRGNCKAG